jgi:hypothetical protein
MPLVRVAYLNPIFTVVEDLGSIDGRMTKEIEVDDVAGVGSIQFAHAIVWCH